LSGKKAVAAEHIGFGNAIKIQLRFKTPWWADQRPDLRDLTFLLSDERYGRSLRMSGLCSPAGSEAEPGERCVPGPLEPWPIGPRRRLLSFSLRTPQRNRNELGETTVNKT
jgi:hypothetical protein